MISVDEALGLIHGHAAPLDPQTLPLADAVGLVLAADVHAPLDIPAYPQSGMDGYAFAHADRHRPLTLVGEQPAGGTLARHLEPGQAVRIFTGAAVPPGADTVLMQERASIRDGHLHVDEPGLPHGANVRPVGSEIANGALALPAGERLSPAAIGFLAGMGYDRVPAYPRPRVTILITGDELQSPGSPLGYGQVYESNSYLLRSALQRLQAGRVSIGRVPDDREALRQALATALPASDIVLMTGGVSVGDHDHTREAFEACGVRPVFHRVRQKPGKPLLFGVHGRQPVFGLPGNPASVLTCFYQYVCPALAALTHQPPALRRIRAELVAPYRKPAGLTHFLKAEYRDGQVRLLDGQASYMLHAFARANALAIIPEEFTHLEAGCRIDADILPE
jgi:molybdopterin molybdotransferase